MGKAEGIIESHLCAGVKALGGKAIKIVNVTGFPDRMCILPMGLVLFVECKTQTGRLSKMQTHTIKWLKTNNHYVSVVASKKEVDELLLAVMREINERQEAYLNAKITD